MSDRIDALCAAFIARLDGTHLGIRRTKEFVTTAMIKCVAIDAADPGRQAHSVSGATAPRRRVVRISPRVSGEIIALHVDDNTPVQDALRQAAEALRAVGLPQAQADAGAMVR